jgi:ubiquinone/menaquinone biosynthesis C-methylase UbiE
MTRTNQDHYRGAAMGWAQGATLVYAPIAALLIARTPIPLTGARVLDVGAGTGVCEAPLRVAGAATVVAADLSHDMLAWNRPARPPAVVADVMRLPFPGAVVDVTVASFVLNHLADPEGGFAELARVVRPGGAVLATVYANSSHSENRDSVDVIARTHGWVPPTWYAELKATAAPLLGATTSMGAAAAAALVDIEVDEEPVDLGLTEPEALVDYRFGQAHFAEWLAGLSLEERAAVRTAAVHAIESTMEPYRPRVVFLAARTASRT